MWVLKNYNKWIICFVDFIIVVDWRLNKINVIDIYFFIYIKLFYNIRYYVNCKFLEFWK